ncbi:hypothetical protein D9619_008967 [Psilocybe cf. subviscida]|uniref:Nephrocystin 3-like N-terminal domain-containing protein n=1 Tax=Psilocybe cf. subviscida TaxID=2480587 RepID=A0A8H5BWL2_9AGAR|nr:hypothetical protein D9619_008967 [Psilocybe cf. subviscida]
MAEKSRHESLKPPLWKRLNPLSRSRPHSPNPSINERDQDRSRPPTPSPSPLAQKVDDGVAPLPGPTVKPSDDISTTSQAEASAPQANTTSAADQQASLRQPAASDSRPDTKPSAPAQTFKRSKYFQQDIGVLHVAFVLQESAELRELICEVVKINSDEQFKDALEPSVSIAADLVAALDMDPVLDGVNDAISTFLGALKTIDWTKASPNEVLSTVQRSIKQIKGIHPHIFAADRQRSSSFKTITSSVLGVTPPILAILKDASSMIPVPMLQPLIGVVAGFLKAADEASNNFEWMRWLASTAGEFIVRIAVICPDKSHNADDRWMRVVDNLRLKLSGIVNKATEFSRRSVASRFLGSGKDKGDVEFMKEELRAAISFFSVEMHIEHKFDLENMSRNIESLLLEQLPRLPEHSLSHDHYFSGSRQDEIQGTLEWVEANQGEHLLWYHGAAGVGKSTYARQLLNHIKAEGMLGAFAYFAIGLDVNPKELVRMMARELADLHPGCRPAVSSAIQNCAGANRGLDEYITHFLVKPIFSLSYSGPLVIILDALDEWVHHKDFLSTLISLPHTRALKFIMTSRYSTLVNIIVASKVHICNLTPVSATVCHDYFKGRFDTIDWDGHYPESHILERLVELADGLLIWAATVCTLVSEPSPHDGPSDILESIVSSSSKVARGDRMEVLYRLAIERIFTNDNEGSKQSRRNILLVMSALQEALPLEEFSRLVGPIRTKFVKETLIGMRAIQTRGTFSEIMVQPAIKLFHASFIDYLGTLEEARIAMAHHFISFLKRSQDTPANMGEKLFRPTELYIGKHFADHLCEMPPDLVSKSIQELESCHIRKWVAWSLAQLMVIGEGNGFPASSHSLLTLSESLLQDHGVIYSPELMTRDINLISGGITGFLTMLELVGIFHGGELSTGGEDHVKYKRDLDKWIHVINGVAIGHLQRQRLEPPGLVKSELGNRAKPDTTWLDSAIELLTGVRAGLSSCPLSILENHALALELDFEHSGVLNSLKEALTLHEDIKVRLYKETPGYATFLNNFAHALHTQFQSDAGCSVDILHRSISLHEQACDYDFQNHYKRATFLDNLGTALHMKYLVEDPKDPAAAIEQIINFHQEAVKLRSNHPMHLPLLLNNLSFALQSQSQLQGEGATEALQQALFYGLRAASADCLGGLELSAYLTTLGYGLCLVSHTQPLTSLHHFVTLEWRAQLTALMRKDDFRQGTLPSKKRGFFQRLFEWRARGTTKIIESRMMNIRSNELTKLAQRVERVVVPKGVKDVVILSDPRLAVQGQLDPMSLVGIQMLEDMLKPGRTAELARLAEPATLVELVGLMELGTLGMLARDAGKEYPHEPGEERILLETDKERRERARRVNKARHAEQAKLAHLAELTEEEAKPGEVRLAEWTRQVERQVEQSRTEQPEQVEQNEALATLAKQIRELLYVAELDLLCLFSARQALSLLPPDAPSRLAIMSLESNIDMEDEELVRGGAFLRLRARPVVALAEQERTHEEMASAKLGLSADV